MALREIAAGHVTRDILKQKDEPAQPSALDMAMSPLNLEGFF
jgi:DNA-directed RNA polymerase subunit omega